MKDIKLRNDRVIKLYPVNVNIIQIETDAALVELTDQGLSFDNIYVIKYGQEVEVEVGDRNVKYKVNYIKKYSNRYLLIETKENISTRFITPILGLTKDECLCGSYHINTFFRVSEEICNSYTDCIYLLYKFSSNSAFLEFEKKIRKHHLFVDIIDPDPIHVLLIMKIPDCYKDDIKLVLEGKYSETSKSYQKKVIKFHGKQSEKTLTSIFQKDENRRLQMSKDLGYEIPKGSELFDKPNLKNEILWEF